MASKDATFKEATKIRKKPSESAEQFSDRVAVEYINWYAAQDDGVDDFEELKRNKK